ncbi:alpha/beta fold hydrolase [Nocardia wallacei]|uniref:alpha/beta fold hydrolase n=1 Tax=Nocardia wallacei TaxID=480035 RepID=UPI002456011D|nr:alpha/beta fold hydrolase [Nocardia wallacei]
MTTTPHSDDLVRGDRTISADGTAITWLARGAGPVILAVHGGLGSAVSMLPLADHLPGFELVAMNCRGHGTSGPAQSPPHIGHEVADVLAVLDTVGPIEMLFGYSYGAVLALETAFAHPDRIPKLALYEPPLPATYPIPDLDALDTALAAGDYERLLLTASAGAGGFSPAELAAVREDPLWLHKVAQAPALAATLRVLDGVEPTVARYAAVAATTTLITGTTSAPYLLEAADLLAGHVARVDREALPGQGHHPDPRPLANALAAALRR